MIRFFDIVFSLIATIILTPFMIPVIIGLMLTGEHHVFYIQKRVGRGGLDFGVLKFATMLKDSPNLPGGILTQKNDPRILPMGNFLRKTKINELPQLLNILIGQMSFVGPRPQARRHYELYTQAVRDCIDSYPPGLTGLGSVAFRDEESMLDMIQGDRDQFHDMVVAPYKGMLEVWYARNRTIRSYFLLIALTAWSIIRPQSRAYRKCFPDLPPPPPELEQYL